MRATPRPQVVDGDPHAEGDRVRVHDNVFSDGRNLAGYVFPQHDGVTEYDVERNAFRAFVYSYDEIDPDGAEPGALIHTFNTSAPIAFRDNVRDSERRLVNALPDDDGVSAGGNVTGEGNVQDAVAAVRFADFMGWPEGTDPLTLEEWTATSGPLGGAPVEYQPGDHVMHEGELYVSIAEEPQGGLVPPDHPETWEHLPLPVDDVRLLRDEVEPHLGRGLLDTLAPLPSP